LSCHGSTVAVNGFAARPASVSAWLDRGLTSGYARSGNRTSTDPAAALLPDIRLGVVRGTTYGLFGAAEPFVPHARALGARIVRVNLYWSPIEPEPGRFAWDAVDALLDQLEPGDEAWVTVCSSSPWATRRATRWLLASPVASGLGSSHGPSRRSAANRLRHLRTVSGVTPRHLRPP
jgi:hypothetical protein